MNRLLRITVLVVTVLIVSIGSFSTAQARPMNVPPTVSVQGIMPWNFCINKGTRFRFNLTGLSTNFGEPTRMIARVVARGGNVNTQLYYGRDISQDASAANGTFILVPESGVNNLNGNALLPFPLPNGPTSGVDIIFDIFDVGSNFGPIGTPIGQRVVIRNYRCGVDNDASLPAKTTVTSMVKPYAVPTPIP